MRRETEPKEVSTKEREVGGGGGGGGARSVLPVFKCVRDGERSRRWLEG